MTLGDVALRNCCSLSPNFQLCVFLFGLEKDRDVRIGVFPECEEVLVRLAGVGQISVKRVRARKAEVRQRVKKKSGKTSDAAMIENFLKLGGGFAAARGWQRRQEMAKSCPGGFAQHSSFANSEYWAILHLTYVIETPRHSCSAQAVQLQR